GTASRIAPITQLAATAHLICLSLNILPSCVGTAVGIDSMRVQRSRTRFHFSFPGQGIWNYYHLSAVIPETRTADPVSFKNKQRTIAIAIPNSSGKNAAW